MNIKTNIFEEYLNFVDLTKRRKKIMDMYNCNCIYTDFTYNYTSI